MQDIFTRSIKYILDYFTEESWQAKLMKAKIGHNDYDIFIRSMNYIINYVMEKVNISN